LIHWEGCYHVTYMCVLTGANLKCYFDTGPLLNIENFFIVADTYLRNLYQVDAATGATAQLLPFGTASNPLSVVYDPTAKSIYWTDVHLHTINRYSLLTNNNTVVYRDPSNIGIGLRVELHCFDLLSICCTASCTTNKRQIEPVEFDPKVKIYDSWRPRHTNQHVGQGRIYGGSQAPHHRGAPTKLLIFYFLLMNHMMTSL